MFNYIFFLFPGKHDAVHHRNVDEGDKATEFPIPLGVCMLLL